MVSYYDSVAHRRAVAEREADRVAQQQQAEEEREEGRREAEDATARHQAKLTAEKLGRQQLAEARLEDELSADRLRLERAWLVANPDMTPVDFDRRAWPHLRAGILEQRQAATVAEALRRAAGDPAYGRLS